MPTLLKHTPCAACGHRHNFCLLEGDVTPDQEYEYLCPETSREASLRPEAPGEAVLHCPQGAIPLTAVQSQET